MGCIPVLGLLLAGALASAPGSTEAPAPGVPAAPSLVVAPLEDAAAVEGSWVANAADNICGLSDLRQVSDPAKVDYPELWDATPEIRKMKDEDIDPGSAEGIQLQQEATDRIREACDEVREDEGYCSVWKRISHKDARSVDEVTGEVIASLSAA